jgi:GTPase SAR1 family protein
MSIVFFRYLGQNLDWLKDALDEFTDDDYLIFDCPGQIELYSHVPVMRNLTDQMQEWGIRVCGVYLIDSLFMADPTKFVSGVLCSLSAMVQMELPHINVLTKCDLVDQKTLDKFLDPDSNDLMSDLVEGTPDRLRPLNEAMASLIKDYSMVSFVPMNIQDEESVQLVLSHVDHAVQYGEDLEPKALDGEDREQPDQE